MKKPEKDSIYRSHLDVVTSAKLTMFNDDWHTFDEVILQLVKALRCNTRNAHMLTSKVHYNGKATIFKGELEQCLTIVMILEEIDLTTSITI